MSHAVENAALDILTLKPRHMFSHILFFFLQVDPSIRSMMALQEERGSTSYSELQNEVTKRSITQPVDSKPPVLRWSRLPGQVGGMT